MHAPVCLSKLPRLLGDGAPEIRLYHYYTPRYDHPHILAGQGTMGLEILAQVPDLDACIIPVGGGGLIAGAAVAIKSLNPDVKIYVRIWVLIVCVCVCVCVCV